MKIFLGALVFCATGAAAEPLTMSCDGTMTLAQPQPNSNVRQSWHEAVSLDLEKRTLDGSLSGRLHITKETPASLDLLSDVFRDESGHKEKTTGTFDRLNGHLNLYNHMLGEVVAASTIELMCEPKKPKF